MRALSLPGPRIAIEAAISPARATDGENHGYHRHLHRFGQRLHRSIKTLTLNINAKFAASEKDNDKAPDYRILSGATEFCAAWKRPPATAIANTFRSNSTIRASRHPSTPRW
jgi:hypothetical protein